MGQDTFDLTFSGKLAPGFELEQAKVNVKQLFRIDDAKTEALFSGKSIVLKKALDSETGNKYRMAMRKAGVVAFLVPAGKTESNSAAVSKASPSSKVQAEPSANREPSADQKPSAEKEPSASFPSKPSVQLESTPSSNNTDFTTALGAQADAAPEPRKVIDAPDFGLAAAGSDLLHDNEKRNIEEVEVDISAISLSEQSGNLVDASELSRPQPVAVNDLSAEVAPAGSDVLRPEERRKVEALQVDTSSISVAEAGERLSKPASAPPPPPNTDHISLEK